MSPEALDDPPVYTKKLDSFSFGVLGIQVITWKFPDPGPRTKKVRDPRDPKRQTNGRSSASCLSLDAGIKLQSYDWQQTDGGFDYEKEVEIATVHAVI